MLLTPFTTPRECLYMQTGIFSVEYMAEENRITYMDKMIRQKETIQRTISNNNNGKGWKKTTEETMRKMDIKPEDIKESKHQTKQMIKEKINKTFMEEINEGGKDKHKVQFLKRGSENKWNARQ